MIVANISPVMQRCDTIPTQVASMLEMCEGFRKTIERHDAKSKEIDEKFDALMSRLAQVETRSTSAASLSASSLPSQQSSGSKRLRDDPLETGSPVRGPADGTSFKPERLWISGFPRKLLVNQLKKVGEQVVERIPHHLSLQTSQRFKNMDKRFAIDFADGASASQALRILRDGESMTWTDPRTQQPCPLYVKPDRSVNDRLVVKTLTSLYRQIKDHLFEQRLLAPGTRLGTTGPRGVLYLGSDEDVAELFAVKVGAGADIRIEPIEEELAKLQVSKAASDAMITKAIAESAFNSTY